MTSKPRTILRALPLAILVALAVLGTWGAWVEAQLTVTLVLVVGWLFAVVWSPRGGTVHWLLLVLALAPIAYSLAVPGFTAAPYIPMAVLAGLISWQGNRRRSSREEAAIQPSGHNGGSV